MILCLLVLLCANSLTYAQLNLSLKSRTTFNGTDEDMSDVWGFERGGRFYAIATTATATTIQDITDPTNPVQLLDEPGPWTYWRDAHVWGDYAYVIDEASSSPGLQIIDLTNLPSPINASTDISWWSGSGSVSFSTAHNIWIDENGIGYIIGANFSNQGVIIIDLNANPLNPPILGVYNDAYVHDAFVRGDTLWTAEVNVGRFRAIDVSNKSNPVVLGQQNTTNNFTHNVWPTDDGKYVLTTDEVGGGFVEAYDVSDITDIKLLDKYQSSPGGNVIPHNVHVEGDFAFISFYGDGVRILDITHPQYLVEVGYYDTSINPGSGGFTGCWGVYPHFSNGIIAATDIEAGLFILEPNYTPASFVEGVVTDATNGNPIPGATVTVNGVSGATVTTDANGYYVVGFLNTGTYTVDYSAPGFVNDSYSVSFSNGVTTLQDAPLGASTPFTLQGQVNVQSNGAAIGGASIVISDGISTYTATSNGSGNFSIPLPGQGAFEVIAGKWGYITNNVSTQNYDINNNTVTVSLAEGYYDDFALDFGWTTSGNAATGDWVLDTPIGTSYNTNNDANPGSDVTGDFGTQAYVTGNAGGGVGNDDIDGGVVVLTSPVFDLSTYADAEISYYRWFFNAGGNTPPDDDLVVKLTNGINTVVVETITSTDPMSSWELATIQVSNYMTLTANMQLIVEASDFGNGHLVEGGIDQFEVTNLGPTATPFTLNGQVNAQVGGAGIGGAEIIVSDGTTTYTATANASGSFSIPLPDQGTFDFIAGQWGYITNSISSQSLDPSNNTITINLAEGYYDDFALDFGWTTGGTGTDGQWVLDTPFGTSNGGSPSNPGADVVGDFGDQAYVTGNMNNPNADMDDVEGGPVILTSPIFDLSGYADGQVSYYRWFYTNGSGDDLVVKLDNGITTATVETITASNATWTQSTIQIANYLTPTANMRLIVEASDNGTASIVEGGIDQFEVSNLVLPTPFTLNGQVNAQVGGAGIGGASVVLSDGTNTYTATSNGSGGFSIPLPDQGTFDLIAGQWGYITNSISSQSLDPSNNTITINLAEGYYDDFALDFGWTTGGTGTAGQWVLDTPYGTSNAGSPSNPGADVVGDFGDQAYVTGNMNNPNADMDDVEGGSVILTSPVFDLSGYADGQVSYYRWFYTNGLGDDLVVKLDNGITTATVETIIASNATWTQSTIQIANYLTPTANMRLIVEASDNGSASIVEGGIDQFEVSNLVLPTPFTLNGQVNAQVGGAGIGGASVVLSDGTNTYTATSNGSGGFSIPLPDQGTFDLIAGQWGYITNSISSQSLDPSNNTITIQLVEGYYDDFVLDFGWTTGGTGTAGQWVLDTPYGTSNAGSPSNPGADVVGDFGDQAYVTGNMNNPNADMDDVEGGPVILTSPVFDLSGYVDGQVSYYRWFYTNGSGDDLVVKLDNGITTATVETITASNATWTQSTIQIANYLTPTANMRLIVEASDNGTASIVEGGIDQFEVSNLVLPTPFTLNGQVNTQIGGTGIGGASVVLSDGTNTYTATSNGSGGFSIPLPNSGTFDIIAGQWGYITNSISSQSLDPTNNTITINLTTGYYDDFVLDFGWTTGGTATDGQWVLDTPYGTMDGGNESNPSSDLSGDFGTQAFVTGNANNANPDDDDVENGTVILSSPIFDLSTYIDGEISYYHWFYTNSTDEELIVKLSNGTTTVVVETITASDVLSSWEPSSIQIADFITPTANMQLIVEASDFGLPSIVEGGIDQFEVKNLVTPTPFTLQGLVNDQVSGNALSGASVIVSDGTTTYTVTSDGSGNFSIPIPNSGTFDIIAGQWGYITTAFNGQSFDPANNTVTVSLPQGYYDDFLFDFGWTVVGSATSGIWEKGEPFGTMYGGSQAQTDLDINSDFGDECFVTGNSNNATTAVTDEVDGETTLLSPIFNLTNSDADINYYRWFVGDGTSDDQLIIVLSNGTDQVIVETVSPGDPFEGQWHQNTIRVSDYISPTATMQLQAISIDDVADDNLLEAGIDLFEVTNVGPLSNGTTVQAKVLLQGPYDPTTGLMNTTLQEQNLLPLSQPYANAPWSYTGIENVASAADFPTGTVDWVLLELRRAADTTVVTQKAAFLLEDGTIVDLNGDPNIFMAGASNGNYYLVVRHRNHIDVLSANPISLPATSAYDFSDPANVVGGASQLRPLPGSSQYGLIAGDFDGNGTILVADFNLYQVQSAEINNYVEGDGNLDRVVTVADFNIYQPNVSHIAVTILRY